LIWKTSGLAVPLFTRLRDEDVLDHETRQRIYSYVKENPGENLDFIRKELGLNTGSMVYHLRVLTREEYLKVVPDGPYRRLYPFGFRMYGEEIHAPRVKVLAAVRENPGSSQRKLSELTGLSPQALSYHLRNLYYEGFVTKKRKGRSVRYYPLDEV
jgi:predicted transcriptional regulator